MHHEAILYSLDPKITFSQLKEQGQIEYDTVTYAKLQERVDTNHINAMMASDADVHFKFLPIRPKVHLFYYLGDISLLNQKILGIVGPRMMSAYGQRVMETVFACASEYDFVTISGMAEGVDRLCHKLSLDQHIPTIAVLGGGLGRYLRRPNHTLIDEIIADGGLVISEYKLFEQPSIYTFPQRNRLIAGLSDFLFLPEAGEKSGSLITVDCAIAMKKPVYATPGSIFSPTSQGVLKRIETGDIQTLFDLKKFFSTHFSSKHISSRPQTTILLTDQEQGLLSILSSDPGTTIQTLLQKSGMDISSLIQMLTALEIKGFLVQEEPGKYCCK